MGTILKISKAKKPSEVRKELDELAIKKSGKKLFDYFGALPDTFGDPLKFQKEVRSEWE